MWIKGFNNDLIINSDNLISISRPFIYEIYSDGCCVPHTIRVLGKALHGGEFNWEGSCDENSVCLGMFGLDEMDDAQKFYNEIVVRLLDE